MSEESTTPDLVELVRLLLEAADRGDLDAVAEPVWCGRYLTIVK
jgi:hypothetical protein